MAQPSVQTQFMRCAMDLFDACRNYRDPELIRSVGLYPYFRPLSESDGPTVLIDGHEVVMLGSNNYLGLVKNREVMDAAQRAIDTFGVGCTGSRFLNGNLALHEVLERELADFLGKEEVVVFSSGFLGNLGACSALSDIDGAVIFSDRCNHASLIDGLRYRRDRVLLYDDLDDLAEQLERRPSWKNALVVTDAVFSMTGKVIDLERLVALKRQYGFHIYLDDAHGIGVLGHRGRGTSDHYGLTDDVDIIFGTFSKSFAGVGGFVACDHDVANYLRHKARSLIFSAALPPASTASALAALRVMRRSEELFTQLWENVDYYRMGLTEIGYCTLGSWTPIQSLLIGSESLAFRFCRDALDLGVFTTPVVHPAVPYGKALIRTAVNPSHTQEHLDRAFEVLETLFHRYPIPTALDELRPARKLDFTWLIKEPNGAPMQSVAHH